MYLKKANIRNCGSKYQKISEKKSKNSLHYLNLNNSMIGYQIYQKMDSEKHLKEGHKFTKKDAVQSQGKEIILSKDQKKRVLSKFKVDDQSFCRLVFQFSVARIKNQDQQDPQNAQKDKYRIPDGILDRIEMSQKSSCVVQEFKAVLLGGTINILQENYLTNLKERGYASMSFGKKLKILKDITMALGELKTAMICHTSISPFWIAIYSESQRQISSKLILHEFSIPNYKELDLKKLTKSKLQFTPYTAPQVRNMQMFGTEADIWSLGAVFYEMMFGSLQGIQIRVTSVQIKYPQGTPQWLQSFFSRTLSFKPANRYSPKEILEQIKPALQCADTAQKFFPPTLLNKKNMGSGSKN